MVYLIVKLMHWHADNNNLKQVFREKKKNFRCTFYCLNKLIDMNECDILCNKQLC